MPRARTVPRLGCDNGSGPLGEDRPALPLAAGGPPTAGDAAAAANTIIVDPAATDQRISGWGGCFNELGWKALLTLPRKDREAVLKAIFDPNTGLRFNICRMPIGASDFALDGYSLDDVPGDYALKHFSIGRDRKLLIPYIKAAMRIRPDLKVWASPWSPPGWMKDNGVYHGGHLRMEPRVLDAYARYLARFAADYHKEGIDLYAVHVQNEPVSSSIYPTCPWPDPEPLRDFIRDYLGPTFAAEKTPCSDLAGDHERKPDALAQGHSRRPGERPNTSPGSAFSTMGARPARNCMKTILSSR